MSRVGVYLYVWIDNTALSGYRTQQRKQLAQERAMPDPLKVESPGQAWHVAGQFIKNAIETIHRVRYLADEQRESLISSVRFGFIGAMYVLSERMAELAHEDDALDMRLIYRLAYERNIADEDVLDQIAGIYQKNKPKAANFAFLRYGDRGLTY